MASIFRKKQSINIITDIKSSDRFLDNAAIPPDGIRRVATDGLGHSAYMIVTLQQTRQFTVEGVWNRRYFVNIFKVCSVAILSNGIQKFVECHRMQVQEIDLAYGE